MSGFPPDLHFNRSPGDSHAYERNYVLCTFSERAIHLRIKKKMALGYFRFHEAINGTVVSAAPQVIYNNDDDNEPLCAMKICSDSWACCPRKKRGCGHLPWPRRAQATGPGLKARHSPFPSPL